MAGEKCSYRIAYENQKRLNDTLTARVRELEEHLANAEATISVDNGTLHRTAMYIRELEVRLTTYRESTLGSEHG